MLESTLAAILHHILAFALIAILTAELVLVRPAMTRADLRLLTKVDLAYGLVALGVLLVGLSRVIWFEKGAEYYLASGWFWLKLSAFLLAGAISVPPTLRFRRWSQAPDLPGDDVLRGTRRMILAQAALLLVVPSAAAIMARGF